MQETQIKEADAIGPAVTAEANAAEPEAASRLTRWASYLTAPVDGASLAVFRICFGFLMLVQTGYGFLHINEDFLQPKFNFSFIPGLHPWPGVGMYEHFAVMACAAVCIMLGAWTRPAALIFCVGQTYLLLLEKTYYQNHFYLICLLAFLLFLTPANRVWSVDNAEGKLARTVPRWSLTIFKAQIFLVYFYGFVAKLNADWLRGQPLGTYLHNLDPHQYFGLAPLMGTPWFTMLITYGGIAIDFSVGFLLWFPPTFWFGAALVIAFHLMNSVLFPVGVFPWVMISTIGLFAAPAWPRRLAARFNKNKAQLDQNSDSALDSSGKLANDNQRFQVPLFILLGAYLAIQILVPLRHFLYPGDVSWTEQGHRFSWQMMLRSKQVQAFQVMVRDPQSKRPMSVNMQAVFNKRQIESMQKRPDMILQFAHYIADRYQREHGVRPIVNVRARESMNYRRAQNLVDPKVDLAAQPDSLLPASWIVPLRPLNYKGRIAQLLQSIKSTSAPSQTDGNNEPKASSKLGTRAGINIVPSESGELHVEPFSEPKPNSDGNVSEDD